MKAQWWATAAIAVVAAAAGYLVARALGVSGAAVPGPEYLQPSPPAAVAPQDLVGQPRPGFVLQDGAGNPVSAAEFDGETVLLNFWASWCAPCVEEMPMLSRLQAEYAGRGLRVVGVAIDQPARAREFAESLDLGYLLLYGETEAALVGRRYGNDGGMLPYTVLLDTGGIVRWARLGAVTRDELEARLEPLLPARNG